MRSAKTRSTHNKPGRKNTARTRVLLLRIIGGFTEKVLYNAIPLGQQLCHLQRISCLKYLQLLYFSFNVARITNFYRHKDWMLPLEHSIFLQIDQVSFAKMFGKVLFVQSILQ